MLFHSVPGAALWPAAMISWGTGSRSSPHRHHSVQLVMALRGTLKVRGGATRRWTACHAALVRSNADHEVDSRGTRTLIGFFDPRSALGKAFAARIARDVELIPMREVVRWRATLLDEAHPGELRALRWIDELLERRCAAEPIHAGVARAIAHVREHVDDAAELAMPTLARIAGLSTSRFMHAFTENVHVPLRPYILWLRLQRATGVLMQGGTIAEAARRVGFSDPSHMTRTFRRMLGTTPSAVVEQQHRTRGISVEF